MHYIWDKNDDEKLLQRNKIAFYVLLVLIRKHRIDGVMVNVIESRAVHRGFEHSIVAFGRKCILHKRKIPQRSTQVVWRQYEEFEDTKGTIRIRTSKMATRKRTKGEKWSIKYYTETYRLSYTNPTKSPGVYSGVPEGLTVPVPLVTPCRVILYTNPVLSHLRGTYT